MYAKRWSGCFRSSGHGCLADATAEKYEAGEQDAFAIESYHRSALLGERGHAKRSNSSDCSTARGEDIIISKDKNITM